MIVKQPLALAGVDFCVQEPALGDGQELVHELACADREQPFALRPEQLGGEAVLRGAVEVALCNLEGDGVEERGASRQLEREAHEERRARHHVGDGRPRGQRAHLDAQMAAFRRIVDRSVPAPHRALVKPQLGEQRNATRARDGDRVLVAHDRQERLVQLDALLEQLERAVLQPTATEARRAARRAAARGWADDRRRPA